MSDTIIGAIIGSLGVIIGALIQVMPVIQKNISININKTRKSNQSSIIGIWNIVWDYEKQEIPVKCETYFVLEGINSVIGIGHNSEQNWHFLLKGIIKYPHIFGTWHSKVDNYGGVFLVSIDNGHKKFRGQALRIGGDIATISGIKILNEKPSKKLIKLTKQDKDYLKNYNL